MKFIRFILIFFLAFFFHFSYAQPAGDSSMVEIVRSNTLEYRKLPDGSELQILKGNVLLKQGSTFFSADSMVVNEKAGIMQAFGKVHINDSDTAHVYSNTLRYLIGQRYAYLNGNVRLTDGHGTLTTNELEYDVASRVGTYRNGGTVVNKKTRLTSREGIYYADLRDVYFSKNVILKDPAYNLTTETLLYNTESQVASFLAPTVIIDSSGRIIKTSEGHYDLARGRAEFTRRSSVVDGEVSIEGDQITHDDASGTSQVYGNGILIDKKNGVTILAHEIYANKKTEAYLATNKPLMIIKQEKDSIYVTADTLFTARLSDLFEIPDIIPRDSLQKDSMPVVAIDPEKDSTNRYFEAFRNVRIFTDSTQAISDSLFYSFRDSTFRLYQDPVVWSNKSQITGDTIFLFTKNKKADRVQVFENSLLINENEPGIYNQVRSTSMDGFFIDGQIDSLRAKGSAESIYFLQDKDSAYTGVNQTASDIMDVYFEKGELEKVVFRSAVNGTLWPMSHKQPGEMRLGGFVWLEERRPKTKEEMRK